MRRREILQYVTGIGVLGFAFGKKCRASPSLDLFVDTNVSLFHWPFRRLPNDDTQNLVFKLRSLGITTAWAGSFEGVFQRDIMGVNERLTQECANHSELLPIGSVNPRLPGWQRDARLCFEQFEMPGIRLHPNYHGYKLDDLRFLDLLARAAEAKRLVQIAVALEDTRTQNTLARVADVDLAPLPSVIKQIKGARVQILNHRGRGLASLLAVPGIYSDCARVDGTDSIRKLIDQTSPGRILFGSHAPFLIPEAALIRMKENQLSESELRKSFAGQVRVVRVTLPVRRSHRAQSRNIH